jgi:hypothetical protein
MNDQPSQSDQPRKPSFLLWVAGVAAVYFGLVFVLSSALLQATQGGLKDKLPAFVTTQLLPCALFVLSLPMKLFAPALFADHSRPGLLSALWIVNGVIWGMIIAGLVAWRHGRKQSVGSNEDDDESPTS